jgi:pimeloyl-ACP methyl ester carboxylesterase
MKTAAGVEFVRTPDECFKDLPDFPFKPKYVEIDGLRQAYVEEGPANADPILLLHGQPSWSYLYRKMIPVLVKAGHRVIAMDHLGLGRSDKPIHIKDYSYLGHIGRLEAFIKKLGLKNITLFCQDWGSLIGLHVAGKHPDWFARIVVGNGSLPVIPAGVKPFPPVENPDEVDDSLEAPFANIPAQQPEFYDKDGKRKFPSDPAGFSKWMAFAMKSPKFRPSEVVEALTWLDLPDKEAAAYDAPFPSRIYMAGIRVFPSLINELGGANQKSWEGLKAYKKPFLTIWASNDPGGMGDQKAQDSLTKNIPGAKGLPHTRLPRSSHFLQDDQGPEIARRIAALIKQHSMLSRDFRNQRYCEVLLVFVKDQKIEAQVWNSYGLGDCPDAAWKALDTEKIKAETKAFRVILNGPRHWMMNKITGEQKERKIMKFGDIPMLLSAILEVQPSGGPAKPYTGNTVNRTTAFTFNAGETVFQLNSPNKEIYTMQSYSLQKDPSLNIDNLPSLASKLKLPEGWSYKAVKLDATLVLEATGKATVIQDELGNTYQKNN